MTGYIRDNIQRLKENVASAAQRANRGASDIKIVAVTKTVGVPLIKEAVDCGMSLLGENRVQELCEKYDFIGGVSWHLIGHLQTNKVKYILDKAELIHSVDSVRLINAIDEQAGKCEKIINFLLQINVSGEDSKFGIDPARVDEFIENTLKLRNVRLMGLMTIPPLENSANENRRIFEKLRKIAVDITEKKYDNIHMDYLSMGMSGDYEEAILEGANIIRVGTGIFGQRI